MSSGAEVAWIAPPVATGQHFPRNGMSAMGRRSGSSVSRAAVLLLLALCCLAARAPAQVAAPAGDGVLYGRVLTSGDPVLRGWVCAAAQERLIRCSAVDSTGAYRLAGLPTGDLVFTVRCDIFLRLGQIELGKDTLGVSGASATRKDWSVAVRGCDQRPFRRIRATFRGHFEAGFESMDFRPCPSDAWFLPSDSLERYPYDARRAWVTADQHVTDAVRWPEGVRLEAGGTRIYFVRWRGTIVGPGRYGHMDGSPFELFVDSIMEVRASAPDDCTLTPPSRTPPALRTPRP